MKERGRYVVALRSGGTMEQPEVTYSDYQTIEAGSVKEAEATYNRINNCSYYHGAYRCMDQPSLCKPPVNLVGPPIKFVDSQDFASVNSYVDKIEDEIYPQIRELEASVSELRGMLSRLINRVNSVTAPHRHKQKVPDSRLDDLSNFQIVAEKVVRKYDNRY